VDFKLFHYLNQLPAGHPRIAEELADFTVWSAPALAIATFCLWLIGRPGGETAARWRHAVVAALGSAGIALLVNQVIAFLWARPRPTTAHPLTAHLFFVHASTDPSFPSDHAAAAFAIAFAVLVVSRPVGLVFVLAAAAISVDRVLLGLHYPGDIAAGIAVAGLSVLIFQTALRKPAGAVTAVASRLTDPVIRPVWNRLEKRTV
jgi:undecaprenyl-diphosphatase